jgi:hypothetical protein
MRWDMIVAGGAPEDKIQLDKSALVQGRASTSQNLTIEFHSYYQSLKTVYPEPVPI